MNAAILAWVPGPFEIVLIFIAALLLFGRRLPQVGRSVGQTIVQFKKGMRDVKDEIESSETKEDATNSTQS
ncbi:MAG: twin-arginine translocase TatA/TatE family subunit [Planctomycetia bacterium]|nr:twin-arginine translocase TatA/TatE family subunit [Planctomycetia bacterium]